MDDVVTFHTNFIPNNREEFRAEFLNDWDEPRTWVSDPFWDKTSGDNNPQYLNTNNEYQTQYTSIQDLYCFINYCLLCIIYVIDIYNRNT